MNCAKCGAEVEAILIEQLSRGSLCFSCGESLRSCVQCFFYAPGLYNNCREPQAERVLDCEKANFCDYFKFSGGEGRGEQGKNARDDAKARLDALFSKRKI